MKIEFQGLDKLPVETREDMVNFVEHQLSDDANDPRLKAFVSAFITQGDPDYINIAELTTAKYFNEEFKNFLSSKQDELLAQFDADGGSVSTLDPSGVDDDEEATVNGDSRPLAQNAAAPVGEVDLLAGLPETDNAEIGTPEHAESEFHSVDPDIPTPPRDARGGAAGLSPLVGADHTDDQLFPGDDAEELSIQEKLRLAEENVRLLQSQLAQRNSGGAANGSGETNVGALLASGGAKLIGGIAAGTGALVEGSGKLAGTILNKAANGLESKGSAVASMQALQGKTGALFDMGIRRSLTGDPEGAKVIDIRDRLNKHIASQSQADVEAKLATMREGRLFTQKQMLLDIVNDVDSGRLSDKVLQGDLKFADVAAVAKNGGVHERAMAAALIAGNADLPDVQTEIDLVTREYAALADQLQSVDARIELEGWSPDEVDSQIAVPMREWIEGRAAEDELLFDLAGIAATDVDQDDLLQKRKAMEELAEMIKKIIQSIFGKTQDLERESGPRMSM